MSDLFGRLMIDIDGFNLTNEDKSVLSNKHVGGLILFSRNFEAFGNKGDVLIVISTSGDSKNIIEVAKLSKKRKITVIGFLGKNGGKVKKLIDIPIIVKSNNTARIQEAHIMLGHFIFEQVENRLINKFNK